MTEALRLDGLAITFSLLAGLLFLVGGVASRGVRDARAYAVLWVVAFACAVGVFVARDLVLFAGCWQLLIVCVGLLSAGWGTAARAAALRLAVTVLAGAAALMVVTVALGATRGSYDIAVLVMRPVAAEGQMLPALLLLFAFGSALPLFPLHGAMVRAHIAAPVPVAIALAGLVGSAAAYGILRICLPLFPQAMTTLAPTLVSVAAIGALYSAIVAFRQDDIRRFIAYLSVSQLHLAVLALFASSPTSIDGGVLMTWSNALVVPAMLLARTPRSIAVVALATIPGLSGFAAQAVVLIGVGERFPLAAGIAALAMIVSTAGALRRPWRDDAAAGPPWRDRLLIAPLVAASLVVGLAPQLVTDLIPPGVPVAERVR